MSQLKDPRDGWPLYQCFGGCDQASMDIFVYQGVLYCDSCLAEMEAPESEVEAFVSEDKRRITELTAEVEHLKLKIARMETEQACPARRK